MTKIEPTREQIEYVKKEWEKTGFMHVDDSRPPVVFRGGLWLKDAAAEKCIAFFNDKHYFSFVAPWPMRKGLTFEELKADFSQWLSAVIEVTGTPAVVIGHSLGGLNAQMVAHSDHMRAMITLASAPPKGIFPKSVREIGSVLRSNLRAFKDSQMDLVLGGGGLIRISELRFNYIFAPEDRWPITYREETYAKYARTESASLYRDIQKSLFTDDTEVDFANPNLPPTFMVWGSRDHICPPTQQTSNFRAYVDAGQDKIECQEFLGMTHGLLFEPGSENVFGAIHYWLEKTLRQ